MPTNKEFSESESLNLSMRGGNWTVQTALDISSLAHAYLQVAASTRSVLVFPDSMCYYRWDTVTTDTISAANDMILASTEQATLLPVPYNLGSRPVLHLKQVISKAAEKCRCVEL